METSAHREIPVTAVRERSDLPTSLRHRLTFQDLLVLAACGFCLCFSIWATDVGWHNTIFDFHSFRQTQTAISSYYMLQTGKVLNYETPVLGPPWSIPFEFPLYQYLVAALTKTSHLPLDFCGRLVSAIFFYATLVPIFFLARDLGFERRYSLVVIALIAVSPHYIYWSRTFMIESTALFFSVSYVLLVERASRLDDAVQKKPWTIWLMVALCGSLAGLVKVTTFASFLLAATLLIVWHVWQRRPRASARLKAGLLFCAATLAPFMATVLWTHHADTLKAQNSAGKFLTSTALTGWNFGTFHQRLALANYHTCWFVMDDIVGNKILLLLTFIVIASACRRQLSAFGACVGLYAVPVAVFFNLYVQHSYYEYANGIFLVCSVGIGVAGTMQLGGKRSWVGFALFVVAISLFIAHYLNGYYQAQRTNFLGRPNAAAVIDEETKPSDVILVFDANDWSSEFPYQCRRRAIMGWTGPGLKRASTPGDLKNPVLAQSISRVKAGDLAALVACGDARNPDWPSAAREELRFPSVRQVSADGCDIYLRH